MIRRNEKGQTLVALLAFMAMAIALTTSATIVTLTNTQAGSAYEQSQKALSYAEAGIDNALIRLLRNPNYSGETLTVGSGTATISISGSGNITITSVGVQNNFQRTIQATVTYTNNTFTLDSWSEIP